MLWLWVVFGGQCAVVCRVPDGQWGPGAAPWLALACGRAPEAWSVLCIAQWGLVYLATSGEVGQVESAGVAAGLGFVRQ